MRRRGAEMEKELSQTSSGVAWGKFQRKPSGYNL